MEVSIFNTVLLLLTIISQLYIVQGNEDVRCKCVCPNSPAMVKNETNPDKMNRKIFIHSFSDPDQCTCLEMVKIQELHIEEKDIDHYCALCECKWQRRNTTTIKVVVIIVICVISLLFLYMLFLLCLDPLMSRRPRTYQEQRNEEVNLDTQSIHEVDDIPSTSRHHRDGALISRVKHEVNRVKGEQAKWKGTVKEQRKNIFDKHTMLN